MSVGAGRAPRRASRSVLPTSESSRSHSRSMRSSCRSWRSSLRRASSAASRSRARGERSSWAMLCSSCSRVSTRALRRSAMALKSRASRPSSSLRRASFAGVCAPSRPADKAWVAWRSCASGAVTWRVRAQQKGAVTASANSSSASATGESASTSQCEDSKGRNSISSSVSSGSASHCGSHQETRSPGRFGGRVIGLRRAAGRGAVRTQPIVHAGGQPSAQDVGVLGVHDVDLQGRIALVHGLDPARQAFLALGARDLRGVAREAGGVQAVERIEAVPGDRGGQHHPADEDDGHGAPEGQEGAPEERASGQPGHQAPPAGT